MLKKILALSILASSLSLALISNNHIARCPCKDKPREPQVIARCPCQDKPKSDSPEKPKQERKSLRTIA